MAKKVQLQSNPKKWEVVDGVEVLVDQEIHDLDPMTDSSCVKIEGHRTLEETLSQDNMFTPEIVETKVMTEVGGVYHDNVVDGAYEQAILYGNTQVNLSEAVTEGSKYIPLPFTSFQGNEKKVDTQKSNYTCQVAPLIKGVTMVNLAQETSSSVPSGGGVWVNNVKPSTKYTLILTYTIQNSQKGLIIQSYNDTTYLENSKQITSLETNVQLTFTTHENANAIRICNPAGFGGETIQLDDIMVLEGDMTDLDIPFFKGMRSVELVKPLTNLLHDGIYKTYGSTTQLSYSNGNVTVTANAIGTWQSANFHFTNEDKLKPNTKYIVMWDSLTQTQTSTSSSSIIAVYDTKSGDGNINIGIANNKSECPVLRSIVFDTTGRDASGIVLRIHATLSNSETGTTTVTGLRVFEWDDSLRTLDLQGIGYFSGTKNVCQHVFKTESKNLYPYGDVKFTATSAGMWCDAKGTQYMYTDVAKKSKARFLLKKGTYYMTRGTTSNCEAIAITDDKNAQMVYGGEFTVDQDSYFTLVLKTVEANVETTVTNIQIERGDTGTTYSAYHGRAFIADGNDEIILRSLPNGVCDTYNLQTGELVQRIGEVVLDETENWSMDTTENATQSNTNIFYTGVHSDFKPLSTADRAGGLVCDKVGVVPDLYFVDKVGIMSNTDPRIYVRVSKTDASNVATFKTYIQNNPLTLQYELETPIIKTITTYDRTYVPYSTTKPSIGNNLGAFAYDTKDHMMIVGNLSPVPPIVESITELPYKMRLKPNTTYTVKCLRGNSQTMSFDLGGTIYNDTTPTTNNSGLPYEALIKTPVSQLSHDYLKISGTGFAQNIIVVEGDIRGTELPYFDGMKDVKMPIVKNIGKNLFDGELIVDKGINQGTGVYHDSEDWVTTKNLIPITKGKKISITIDADDEDITSNRRYVYVYKYDMNGNFIANDRYDLGLNAKTYTMNHYGYVKCTIRTHNIKNITITETDTPQPCIDYRANSIYAVQGEYPITSEMIEQGGFTGGSSSSGKTYEQTKYDNITRLRSKDLIPVKPNTTYAFAHSFSKFAYNVYQWNGNKEFIDGISHYFASGQVETITTTANTQYIHFLMAKHDGSQALAVADYDWSQFHMYELDSTINLRSLPNGVKDELNLLTGEYIQRVGEVVFDGSDDEDWNVYTDGDFALTPFFHITFFNWLDGGSCTNKYHNAIKISSDGELGYCIYGNGVSNNIPRAILRVRTNEIVNGLTIESWKEELKISPLILQYKLAEPIISHVRLVSSNQEREVGVKLPNGVCNTYNPSTGITTVRVGKIVLDGNENWYFDTTKTNTQVFGLIMPDIATTQNNLYCETMRVASGVDTEIIATAGGTLFIALLKTKASTVDELKTYLASNPITVWYELKYPQIQTDIVLPNGVHDEYNPETGVYTKKVGFIEFDGSADEIWYEPFGMTSDTPTIYSTWTSEPLPNAKCAGIGDRIPGICNSLKFNNDYLGKCNFEMYFISDSGRFNLNIERTKLSSGTAVAFNQYLSQNPIKLWYELQTPITYQLTPYFGLPTPYAYEDGYVIMESVYPETTLPPEFNYKLLANRTGQVMQNNRKLQEHTTRLSNLEAIIIEATIESLFNREMQRFELELMDIQLIDLGE